MSFKMDDGFMLEYIMKRANIMLPITSNNARTTHVSRTFDIEQLLKLTVNNW